VRWQFDAPRAVTSIQSVGGRVLVRNIDSQLRARDAATGREVWGLDLVSAFAVRNEHAALVARTSGGVDLVDPTVGAIVRRVSSCGALSQVESGLLPLVRPAVIALDDTQGYAWCYVPSGGGGARVTAFDLATGRTVWEAPTQPFPTSMGHEAIVVTLVGPPDRASLLACGRNGETAVFDRASGAEQWHWSFGACPDDVRAGADGALLMRDAPTDPPATDDRESTIAPVATAMAPERAVVVAHFTHNGEPLARTEVQIGSRRGRTDAHGRIRVALSARGTLGLEILTDGLSQTHFLLPLDRRSRPYQVDFETEPRSE
jgi:hypothetical protein